MSTLITIQAAADCFQVKVAKSNKDLRIKDLTEKHHAPG